MAKTTRRYALLESAMAQLSGVFVTSANFEFRTRYLIEQLALTTQALLLISSAS